MEKIEKIVFKALEEQVISINQIFKHLGSLLMAYFDGDEDQAKKIIIKIRNNEKKVSKLKKALLNDIPQAESSIYRTDYLRIVLQMSELAGFQAGAAVRLGNVGFKPTKEDEMKNNFVAFVDVFLNMGDIFSNTIKSLNVDMRKAKEYCEQIDDYSFEIDDVYRTLEAYLYSRKNVDWNDLMQLRTVALHIKRAIDIVQRLADSIRIILATH